MSLPLCPSRVCLVMRGSVMAKFADLNESQRSELMAAADRVCDVLVRVFRSQPFLRYIDAVGLVGLPAVFGPDPLRALRAMSLFVREQDVTGATDQKWFFVDCAAFAIEAVTDAWPYMEFADRQRYLRWSDEFLQSLSREFLEEEPAF